MTKDEPTKFFKLKKEITYSAPMLIAGANGQLRVAFEKAPAKRK